MKEALLNKDLRIDLVDSPIPKPQAHQLVIKVEVSGFNPKDYQTRWVAKLPIDLGDELTGTVHEVGEGITGFEVFIYRARTFLSKGGTFA